MKVKKDIVRVKGYAYGLRKLERQRKVKNNG